MGSGGSGTIYDINPGFGRGFSDFTNGAGNLLNGRSYDDQLTGSNGGGVTDLIANNKPKPDLTLADIQKKQMAQTKDFRENLPAYKNQNAETLGAQSNQQLGTDQGQLKQMNAGRGMLYGGVNEDQQGKLRSHSQTNLANAVNQSNIGLEDAADTMDQQAVSTAYGVQQTKQAAQNQAYSQAVAQMNSQNAMMGSAMSTALMIALL